MEDAAARRYVWDLPTRLFHWGIVVLLGFSWWCAETGRMEWHYRSGLTLCALVLFRLVWGFTGSSTARFSGFVKGPRTVWRYVRQKDGETQPLPLGHNPIGGWSVLVLLGLLTLQIVTGLFAVDLDGLESGPLSYLLDFDRGRTAALIHEVSFNVLLAVSAIHVLAILFYLVVRRRNLTWAMVSGYQRDGGGEGLVRAPLWRLVLAIVIALTVAYAVSAGFRF
ncbi:MAG: cytochrome b/b6 domain-containing protein [Novosphingobium sp.]|nr:cytochrome b/b6 domain-containing protein [Novosphingobium sp.]